MIISRLIVMIEKRKSTEINSVPRRVRGESKITEVIF